ncbi:MAG: VOC family protein [Isosphaeraceae bacterium]
MNRQFTITKWLAYAESALGGKSLATGSTFVRGSGLSNRLAYIKHLGLKVTRDGGEDNCFLGAGNDFFLTLFRGDKPGLNHYCYSIGDYNVERAEEKLKSAGFKPRREGNRIYFPDADGIEVQVAGA